MKKIFIPIALVMVLLLSACGNTKISEEKAKEIALQNAGLSKDDVTFIRTEKDRDDGRTVYEIEFYSKDRTEYDYEIDADTGDIISYDSDAEGVKTSAQQSEDVTEQKAKEIALAKVPGATENDIREFKADRDNGKYVYEGKIIYNNTEYDFEIDIASGNIIKWETESVFD